VGHVDGIFMTMGVTQPTHHRLKWSSLTGGIAGLAAWGCSTALFWNNQSGWGILIVASTVAAFLTSFGLWYWLMAKRPQVTVKAGIVTGGLIGLLAHPLAWYLGILLLFFSGQTDSLGERTATPIEGILIALIYTLFSLAFIGWVTIPLGAIVGGVIAYAQSRLP
jgi:hypothetical protein